MGREAAWRIQAKRMIAFAFVACALLVGRFAPTAYGATQSEGVLEIDIRSANVRVIDCEEAFFAYDRAQFTVSESAKGDTRTIRVAVKTGEVAQFGDVELFIPLRDYETVVIRGDHAGISLPELDKELRIDVEESALRFALPETFSHSVTLNASDSAIQAVLHEDMTGYRFALEEKKSAVKLPDGVSRDFEKGDGKASVSQTLENCAYTLKWYTELEKESTEGVSVRFA